MSEYEKFLKNLVYERAEKAIHNQRLLRAGFQDLRNRLYVIETSMEMVHTPNLQDVIVKSDKSRDSRLLTFIEEKECLEKFIELYKKEILKFERAIENFDQEEKDIIYSKINKRRMSNEGLLQKEIVAKEEKVRQTLRKLGQILI